MPYGLFLPDVFPGEATWLSAAPQPPDTAGSTPRWEDYFRRLCYNVGVSQRLRAGIYRRYPKAVVLECMKWAATLLLSLTMSPRKSLWLTRMRYEISRGLFSRAGH